MIARVLLDLVLVAILIYGPISGWKHGFLIEVFTKFRWLTRAVLALLIARPVGALLCEHVFYEPISLRLRTLFADALGEDVLGATTEELVEHVPRVLRGLLDLLGVDYETEAIASGMTGEALLDRMVELVAEPAAMVVGCVVAFLLAFVLLRFFLGAIVKLVDLALHLPVLATVNRILGLVFGLLFAALTAWFVVTVLALVFDILASGDIAFFRGFSIEKTWLARFFYEFAPLEFLLAI